jgi:hypothetical protein
MDTNTQYSQLEVAKIIGEPRDPRKPLPELVELVCDVSYAEPEDYIYYFDVLTPTDRVLTITSTGTVTDVVVTPDTPVAIQFADFSTPNYNVKFTEYAKRKESTLVRVNKTINNSLNSLETYRVVQLLNSAATTAGNLFTPASGQTGFKFPDLIDMKEAVMDFGDKLLLVCGSQIDKDIDLWDWTDNKYHSLKEAFDSMGVTKLRIGLKSGARSFDFDDDAVSGGEVTTSILPANVAYLVATSDVDGYKPFIFVRKKLDSVAMLGGVVTTNGDKPERLIIASPNPVTLSGGTTKYLAIGVMGFEEIAMAVVNPNAVAKFTR